MDHDEMKAALKRATEDIPTHGDGRFVLWQADCREALARLDDNSVDAIVTDPPYGLEFMGKEWDAPWKAKPSREFNDIEKGTLGGFTKLPNHSRVNNVRCEACQRWKFSSNPCACDVPQFPNARLDAMSAFQAWFTEIAAEALRVLKPGGHLLAFGGSRTYHRLACAVEDAGFEIRDQIMWVYGSGFPKSLDVGKAIDKTNGEPDRLHKFTAWMRTTGLTARQIDKLTNTNMGGHYLTAKSQPAIPTAALWEVLRPHCGDVPGWVDELVARIEAEREVVGTRDGNEFVFAPGENKDAEQRTIDITAPATDAAKQWQGWGTALKPAHEPIVVARKPLEGTVAANVLKWGTGALNIDGTRVDMGDEYDPSKVQRQQNSAGAIDFGASGLIGKEIPTYKPGGRWPANFIHDGSDEVLALFPDSKSASGTFTITKKGSGSWDRSDKGMFDAGRSSTFEGYGDAGSAARFFYCAKAGKKERNAGLGHLPTVTVPTVAMGSFDHGTLPDGTPREMNPLPRANHHPTVKPIALMRYLIRLVTPPGGIVLDPFAGSGTTMVAAIMEGAQPWGCEMTEDYIPIILGRIQWALDEVDSRIAGTL